MKTVLILGLGKSGQSAVELLLKDGYRVIGFDDKNKLETHIPIFDPNQKYEFSFAVISPGFLPEHPICSKLKSEGVNIIGEIELASSKVKQPCIGITGTNGKTTVCYLIEHVLKKNGYKAKALGNIGTPFASYFLNPDPEEILVIELSSYQLETMYHKIFDVGVIINITPDHLDRYLSMTEYANAKLNLKNCIKPEGKLYLGPRMSEYLIEGAEIYPKLPFEISSNPKNLAIGEENLAAAFIALSHFGIDEEAFKLGLSDFVRPEHRIKFIKEIEGVKYFNDSKATNVDSVIHAISALTGSVILIAGGKDKGFSYRIWRDIFVKRVKAVIAIGEAKDKIFDDVSDVVATVKKDSLAEAVIEAKKLAKMGDTVLLAPGCSSFDMFRDYKHRGEEFEKLVQNLKCLG